MNWITLEWIALIIIGIALLWLLYDFLKWLVRDRLLIICKDGKLLFTPAVKKKGCFVYKDEMYPIDSRAVHSEKGFMFWRKTYVFSEGNPAARRLEYKEDKWFDTTVLTKIINDEHIKTMVGEVIAKDIKLWIILGGIGGILAALASIINLAITMGLIKS